MRKYRLLFLVVTIILNISHVFGADKALEEVAPVCSENIYSIKGNENALVNNSEEFTVVSQSGALGVEKIVFSLTRDGEAVESKNGAKYVRIFSKPGEIILKANITVRDCKYEVSKNVTVYQESYIYIGNQIGDIEENFSEFFGKKNILFSSYTPADTGIDLLSSDGVNNFVTKYKDVLLKSNVIFVDESISINLFDALLKLQKLGKENTFDEKEIFVITSRNYSFLTKVLAPYIKQIGVKKIGFIRVENFLDSLSNIITKTPGNITYASFGKESNFLSINTFLRYLTFSGLELSFLGMFLSMTLAVLVVNFCKQFIGLNSFGVYYPVLLALCITFLGIRFVCVFLILGFVSIFIVNLILKKIYLMYSSRRAVLITTFSIVAFVFLGIDNYFDFGIIEISLFSSKFILFPFIYILLVADKVLHEEVHIFSKKGLYYFFELVIITGISYFVINSSNVQYFLLSYPDTLFLIFGCNILVGRYTGLQIMEYVRFLPLIKKLSEEE